VDTEFEATGCPMNRRRFLTRVGAGAAATALTVGGSSGVAFADAATEAELAAARDSTAFFGRIFPRLPPFATPSKALTEALTDLGRPGGLMDAKDDHSQGPIPLITDPALRINNPDNPNHTAGTTFFGQFLDHDVTFDVTSALNVPTEPRTTRNERNPRLNLDSVYGGGPRSSSHLYAPGDRAKLRIEHGGLFEDLPRTSDMTAIIADPRNDENMMLSGLQAAFILFHNHAVDLVRSDHAATAERQHDFARAHRLTMWHYQWIITHEFLPQIVGQALVNDIFRNGRRFYRPADGKPVMPVEFQGAAYRFGHSMVRPSYRANLAGDNGGPFFGFTFDPALENEPDPDDLVGGFRAPRRFIGWQTFFDFADTQIRRNKTIDTRISTVLFNLPLSTIATADPPAALPQRNLLRGVTWSLPSGQAIARRMGVAALPPGDFPELTVYGLGLEASTPLWYYVLREAQLVEGGLRLGPAGGRIVAEVIIGLLQLDPASYVNAQTRWRPTLPTRSGAVTGTFNMADFLTFAGVDPISRGQ